MEKCLRKAADILKEVRKVVIGKDDVIIKALTAVFAGGHILIEDIPGVGKTTLAVAFAKSMSLDYNRLQFTPDVLPSDVTGFSIYNANDGTFEYKPGAVMCNLFLADEINRTSSKTQSSLLEVMEEGAVTVDGVSHKVDDPFVVIATQNPVGSLGTQRLPESQMDRFMIRLSMGYPQASDEVNILKGKSQSKNGNIAAVATKEDVVAIRKAVDDIHISDDVLTYVVNMVNKTRSDSRIELGISPRGTIAIVMMAKSNAFMHGRNYVVPNDVKEIFADVGTHRIVLSTKAKIDKLDEARILKSIMADCPVPQI